jgi:dihydroorotase
MTDRITIRRPDDWHVHLRDGDMLKAVAGYTARQFRRAIVMPNLKPPVTTPAMAQAYRARILEALPPGSDFDPLITCYLTNDTDPDVIAQGFESGAFAAAKLYPANATTNSAFGVTDIEHIFPVLARMEEIGMPFLVHGEVTDHEVDVFDREAVFIDRIFSKIVTRFPQLRTVFEHITTEDAAQFVAAAGPNIAATITPQHLHLSRNDMLVGGIRPHLYCLPILKREKHRLALRKAATSGSPKFFLGTDTAPHAIETKEAACGCAGIFNAPFAIESYAAVFDEEGALDKLEAFAALNGPAFYRLPVNEDMITLERGGLTVPTRIAAAGSALVPFHAGETMAWRLVD